MNMSDADWAAQMCLCTLNGAGARSPWLIALPDDMLNNVIKWHHHASMHAEGPARLFANVSQVFCHPDLRCAIDQFVSSCDTCAQMKVGQRQHGHHGPRDPNLNPWLSHPMDTMEFVKIPACS